MTKNKAIFEVHFKYHLTFEKICKDTVEKYRNLPIDWEDIYYEFLYLTPSLLAKFDARIGVSQKTYLGLKCKYFANNKCRSFSTNKYKVLNNRIPLVNDESRFLADSQKNHGSLNTSVLSAAEQRVFAMVFLDGQSLVSVGKATKQTPYKVKKVIESIKFKLKKQVR